MKNTKNVLITGGLGFVGVHAIEKWNSEKWNIYVIDNMSSNAIHPEEINNFDNVKIYDSSILSLEKSKFNNLDLIVHLASPVGPVGVLRHSGKIGSMILNDLEWCVEVAKKNKCPLIFISTSEIYGFRSTKTYLKEEDDKVLHGEFTVRNEYSAGKILAEIMLTNIGRVDKDFKITTLGTTLDDSAGECFDKIARKLGLDYPGGPAIANRSELSKNSAFKFPRPMINSENYNFSFSGLKTHVINLIQKLDLNEENINNISYELQNSIVETLINKATKASKNFNIENIVVTGGVSANRKLREDFDKIDGYNIYFPDVKFSTDNGAMIAYSGYLKSQTPDCCSSLKVKPNPSLTI